MSDFAQRTCRLLEHHSFLLNHYADTAPGAFVELFRHTWSKLPLGARRSILASWRTRSIPVQFELSDAWSPSEAYAQVRNGGLKMCFRKSVFAQFPAKSGAWVISHELAHVFNHATGISHTDVLADETLSAESRRNIFEMLNEAAANNVAEDWGFSRSQLNFIEILSSEKSISIVDACIQYPKYTIKNHGMDIRS